jgi:hypothetical protein
MTCAAISCNDLERLQLFAHWNLYLMMVNPITNFGDLLSAHAQYLKTTNIFILCVWVNGQHDVMWNGAITPQEIFLSVKYVLQLLKIGDCGDEERRLWSKEMQLRKRRI